MRQFRKFLCETLAVNSLTIRHTLERFYFWFFSFLYLSPKNCETHPSSGVDGELVADASVAGGAEDGGEGGVAGHPDDALRPIPLHLQQTGEEGSSEE